MGVRRGAWEKYKRGNVWRPGMLAGGIPALSMGDALRQGARLARGKGQNPWLGVADDMLKGFANLAIKFKGISDAQLGALTDAQAALGSYEDAVRKRTEAYDPTRMAELQTNVKKAQEVYDSFRTKFGFDVCVERVSQDEAMHSFVAGNDLGRDTADAIMNTMIQRGGILNGNVR